MKLNFSNLNFSIDASTSQSFSPQITIPIQKLKNWWRDLSQQEREEISSFNIPELIQDLANAANNALLACKLHPSGKTKDLVSWKKNKMEGEKASSHTFGLNLIGKEILDKDLAELFSSFYILVVRDQHSSKHQFGEKETCPSQIKSHIGIKKEKLENLMDLLEKSILNFSEDEKVIEQEVDSSGFYSFLIKQSPQNLLPNANFPTYLKKLLERFAMFSFLLEQKIYKIFKKVQYKPENNTKQDKEEQILNVKNDKFSEFCSILKGLGENDKEPKQKVPEVVKTVSQLENAEKIDKDIHKEQSNTANNSTLDVSILETSPHLKADEPEELHSQESPRKEKVTRKITEEIIKESKFSIPANTLEESAEAKENPHIETLEIYEGLFVGVLDITFDMKDLELLEDPLRPYHDSHQVNNIGIKDSITGEHVNNFYEIPKHFNSFDSYYMTNSNLQYLPTYSHQPLYDISGYYPNYSQQNTHAFVPYNYEVAYMLPSQHIDSNLIDPYYSQNYHQEALDYINDYKDSSNRKTSFDSHSNFNERENYSGKLSESFYPSSYERQYETRAKLPPRFQKRKESNNYKS